MFAAAAMIIYKGVRLNFSPPTYSNEMMIPYLSDLSDAEPPKGLICHDLCPCRRKLQPETDSVNVITPHRKIKHYSHSYREREEKSIARKEN